jgi:hypothetical protein
MVQCVRLAGRASTNPSVDGRGKTPHLVGAFGAQAIAGDDPTWSIRPMVRA